MPDNVWPISTPSPLLILPEQARFLLDRQDVLFIDIRTPEAFAQARIPGAISIPAKEVASRYKEIIIHDFVIVYGSGGEEDLTPCIVDVFRYHFEFEEIVGLAGGFTRWADESHPVDRTPVETPRTPPSQVPWEEIDVLEAYCRLQKGHTLLDIREPMEIRFGYPEGAIFMPMNEAPFRLEELARMTPLLLICNSGNRSGMLAEYLLHQGFDPQKVANVVGGVIAWQIFRLPWVRPATLGAHSSISRK